jgi:hypothetical protein
MNRRSTTAGKTISWFDISDWGIEGKGWNDTQRFYDRLPWRARRTVTPSVWNLSRSATGISACFESNATRIHARWRLRSPQLGEANFSAAAFSGLDLYARDKGAWRWCGAGHLVHDQKPRQVLVEDMAPVTRQFLLYLPLRNPVAKVEIGIERGSSLKPVAPRRERPVVYYGTSIVHGAYASHAGMVHASILGRWLDKPMINLGFSGAAKMEIEVADLLSELKAAVYVIDPLPNMDPPLIKERAERFLDRLRKGHPTTPVVMVEDRPLTNAWIKPDLMKLHEDKWRHWSRLYRQLRQAGDRNLYYVKGRSLFGNDSEASLDASHPGDLGFMRMAEHLYPVLKGLS